MKTKPPLIFEYIDYKKYLRDYYYARKKIEPGFSHTYICFKLGQQKSKTYFSNVMACRKEIGPSFIDRFIDLLELSSDEAKYFRALVSYNQTISPQEKEFFFDQLVRLNKTPRKFIEQNEYDYFKSCHHGIIRSLLDVMDISREFKEISKRLTIRLSINDVRKSISLLMKLGLIKKDTSGFLKPTDKVVSTPDEVHDEVIKCYQMSCLELGREAIAAKAPNAHRMSTLTFSCSEDAYRKISGRLKQLRSEIRSIVHKDEMKASNVYHINLQMFNLTK